jgi:hypothetical protein
MFLRRRIYPSRLPPRQQRTATHSTRAQGEPGRTGQVSLETKLAGPASFVACNCSHAATGAPPPPTEHPWGPSRRPPTSAPARYLARAGGHLRVRLDCKPVHGTRHCLRCTRYTLRGMRQTLRCTRHTLGSTRRSLHSTRNRLCSTRHTLRSMRHTLFSTRNPLSSTRHTIHSTRHSIRSTRQPKRITRLDDPADRARSTARDACSPTRASRECERHRKANAVTKVLVALAVRPNWPVDSLVLSAERSSSRRSARAKRTWR